MDDCKFSQFHEFEQKSVNDYFKQSVFIFEVKAGENIFKLKKNVGWGPEKAQNQFSGWKGGSGAWELENINFLHNAGLLSSFIPLTNPSIDKSIWSQIYNSFSDHRTAAGQMGHLLNFSKRLVGRLSEYLAEKSAHSSNNVHQSKSWSHSGSV